MSKHMKRYFAPKSWKLKRKGIKFVLKTSPGTHKLGESLPMGVILRDILNIVDNKKEVMYVLREKNILVDGIKRNDHRFPIGLFDVLSIADTKEYFRVILDKQGKITLIKISSEEGKLKLCKIQGKSVVKGKIQLNLYDGKNLLVDKSEYKVGDAILISIGKKNEIKEKIGFDKNILVYLTGGKHIGQIGKIQDIKGNRILYKTESGNVVETLKEYAFPIGKDKPLISIQER